MDAVKFGMLVILAGTLLGCVDETPPHMEDVCVRERTWVTMQTIWTGKTMVMMPITHRECLATERKCVWGKDFKGYKSCYGAK